MPHKKVRRDSKSDDPPSPSQPDHTNEKKKDETNKPDASMEVDSSSSSSSASSSSSSSSASSPPPSPPLSVFRQTVNQILEQISSIEKSTHQKDPRHLGRVLRVLTGVRHKLTIGILRAVAKHADLSFINAIQLNSSGLTQTAEDKKEEENEEIESETAKEAKEKTKKDEDDAKKKAESGEKKETSSSSSSSSAMETDVHQVILPEVSVYLSLLLLVFLLEQKANKNAFSLASTLFSQLQSYNRRSLDLLSAKVYSYYSLAAERLGDAQSIRSDLLVAHRTACLQHNEPGVASLTNCILRNYLLYHLYSQADTFRLKSSFPESRSTSQYARYLYYCGKLAVVQLHYSDAFHHLTQAIRKAPQQKQAIGFRQQATKLIIITQLLMGEIPERTLFASKDLKASLFPYLQLTRAVRVGDIELFNSVTTKYKVGFEADETESLIVRLRHNVIKAGLRKINLSYSKISLADIAEKLKLETATDAEYIVVKAISDGVIDAYVDKKEGTLVSNQVGDVYASNEPQQAFHKRIEFTIGIHHEAVKALRFPPNAYKTINEQLDEEEDEEDIGVSKKKKEEDEKKKEEEEKKEAKKKDK